MEVGEAALRYELGRKDRDGRHADDDERDAGVEPEHEDKREYDGQHATEQLLERHGEAVGELLDVGHDAVHDVSVAMGVHVGDGQDLELCEGPLAHLANDGDGYAVRECREQPLRGYRGEDRHGKQPEVGEQARDIRPSRACDAVDGFAREDGHE